MAARQKGVTWACVWVCAWACVSGVRLEDGVYKDLVLAIDPDMSSDVVDMTRLKQNIEALVTNMQDGMSKATHDQLSVGTVRVVLPHWWNKTELIPLESSRERFSWQNADIRLQEPPRGGFGEYSTHSPHTLQTGQCGMPGRYITIHTTFLDNDYANTHYGPRGNVLMHEWAHYRWGVFDEYGHPLDQVYPVSYQEDDLTLPTACQHGQLYGDFLTQYEKPCPGAHNDESKPCYFFPNSSSDPATTMSSLLSHPYLSDGSFCDETTHNFWAPTPQNQMCGQRSVWEVLDAHPDFMEQQTGALPSITFHKAPMPRVFFLFEAPSSENLPDVQYLVNEFVAVNTELYGEIEFGMATFKTATSGTVEIFNKLSFMTITDYSEVEKYLPEAATDSASEALLDEALMKLLPYWNTYQPGTLLVSVIWNPIVAMDAEEHLSAQVLDHKVKLLILNSVGEMGDVLPMMSLLQTTGGKFYIKDSQPKERLLRDLDEHLKYNKMDDHRMLGVSSQEVSHDGQPARLPKVSVTRWVEKQVNGYLRITPFDPKSIEITIANPLTYQAIKCNEDNKLNLKLHCTQADDGIFVYFETIEVSGINYLLDITNTGKKDVVVEATWSVVENMTYSDVSVAVWSSSEDQQHADIFDTNNLFLYCQVYQSSGVLEGLEVTAEVEFSSQGKVSSQIISLSDAGGRGVDVKARDSVFSGQLEGSWPAGTTFTVTTLAVHHNPDIFSPFHHIDTARWNGSAGGGVGEGSSGVLPIDPSEGDCCLSYSDRGSSRSRNFNLVLRRPYSTTINKDIQETPPRVVNTPQMDMTDSFLAYNDTLQITLLLSETQTQQRTTTKVNYEYLVRYHEDFFKLRDNFTEADEPLEGSEWPGDVTSITVKIQCHDCDDLYLAVATYYPTSGIMSLPSTATHIQVNSLPLSTTTTSTTTTTTTPPSTTSTKPPPTTSTPKPTPSKEPTAPPTPPHEGGGDGDDGDNDQTTVIVVSVVCSVVGVALIAGLIYYFRSRMARKKSPPSKLPTRVRHR